jgi:hypothetical protein
MEVLLGVIHEQLPFINYISNHNVVRIIIVFPTPQFKHKILKQCPALKS